MEVIQSRDNALIKEIKKLSQRKFRDDSGSFFIEGFRFVEEALKAEAQIERVLVLEDKLDYYYRLAEKYKELEGIKCCAIKSNLAKDVFETGTPQGIGAIVKKTTYSSLENEGLYVLLDKLQDPGNVGTIIRTAHAAGASGVIYTSGTVDPYNDKALRASMGSIFYIPVIEDKSFETLIKLKSSNYTMAVSDLEGAVDFYNVAYHNKFIIAIGNEGSGVSEEIKALSDLRVKIPMPGGAESLNAGVAASVMIYEILRQNIK